MSKYSKKLPLNTMIIISNKTIINNMISWAKKIGANNHYYYKNWSSNEKTHKCPICHPELLDQSYEDYPKGSDGWNCIGFAYAVWHHGGELNSKCNCGVISNGVAEQILNAKTNAEALKIAQNKIGLKDIKVIRNKGKAIPKYKAKPGDIAMLFNGRTYQHTYVIVSKDYVADSTGSGSKNNHIRANRSFDGRYVSGMKLLIRYTGKKEKSYLSLGDKSTKVKQIQAFLNWVLDLNLNTDGVFGEETEKAVKKFQTKVFGKENADGKFGSKSLEAAKNFDKPEKKPVVVKKSYPGALPFGYVLKYKDSNKKVAQWQEFLNWYFGKKLLSCKGNFRNETLKYTKLFQKKELGSKEADGIVGPKTLEAAKKCKK